MIDIACKSTGWEVLQGDLVKDETLETAVRLSLLTDAGDGTSSGWWGNGVAEPVLPGSKLWTLARAAITRETLRTAEEMAREALQWLITDGKVREIVVTAQQHHEQIRMTIRLDNASVQVTL